jgi:GMP synthase (glutamine-hydrolysing)
LISLLLVVYNMNNTGSGGVRVALLDASVGETPAERNFTRELDAEVRTYKVSEGEFPPRVDASERPFDAVVVSGSQTSVYDEEPWIAATAAWVREAVKAGVPLLGVCWGHQLLARAVGGEVDPMGGIGELGYTTVERLETSDPLFDGVDPSFVAFETHTDEVTALPSAATPLAETERALQAFRVENAWGAQFHPEYDRDTARWVTENKRGWLDDETVDAVLETVTAERHAQTAQATRVFDNFLAVARRTSTPREVSN